MQPRSVIITGSTSGLGRKTAGILCRDPRWQVVLACRDLALGKAVAEELGQRAAHPLLVVPLELGSLASIRAFPAALDAGQAAPIGALVCNAGLQITDGLQRTEDGFERTFGVNHLGHFALTRLLLGRLADNARVVVVSSGTHDPAQKTGMPAPEYSDPVQLAQGQSKGRDDTKEGQVRYTTSKLCNVYFARELARVLAASGDPRLRSVRVAAFDPGLMPGTGLAREYPAILRFAWSYVMPVLTLVLPNVNSVGTSAKRLAALVSEQSPAWESGAYLSQGKVIEPSKEAHDGQRAKQLWAASEELWRGALAPRPASAAAP